MELTVCICVRDGAAYVDDCLVALLRETAAFETPIVVVDHASKDETPHRLERWARDYGARLRVLRFEGEGLAAARDFAWQQAATPWLAFVDIDCTVQPGWAKAAYDDVRRYGVDPSCAAFGGTNHVHNAGGLLHRAYSLMLPSYVGGHGSILNRPVNERRQVDHCPTLNVVYRRAALELIHGFDPDYTRVSEDLDLSYRLVRQGYTLWLNPDMKVEHALRPTLSGWLRNMFLYGRGKSFYVKRHPDAFDPKYFAPGVVVLAYLTAGLCSVRGAHWLLPALAGLHIAAIALLLLPETRRQGHGWAVWIAASLVVWLTHLSFGAGVLFELPRRRDRFVV